MTYRGGGVLYGTLTAGCLVGAGDALEAEDRVGDVLRTGSLYGVTRASPGKSVKCRVLPVSSGAW